MEEVKGQPTEPISMESLTEEALEFDEPRRNQLREGIILEVRGDGLVVDIGAKRDGFVSCEDFKYLNEEETEFKVGQSVPVIVTHTQGHDGNVQLSISQAKLQTDWLEAERLKNEETTYETEVLEANRGGLTVQFGQLRGFVPMSQLIGFNRIRQAAERHRRLRALVGKPIILKVIEVNRRRKRLIFSQQAAAKEWRAMRRQQLLEELEAGQVRTGRLSQIADFGLFVNLGGLDGLVHVSELSWGRIDNPADVYRIGQRLKVKVLSIDHDRQRIALSIKALKPDPWESVPERYAEGQLVEGKVTQMTDFGAFVELEPGVEGLLHNSELLSMEQREELETKATVLVKIIRIEPNRRRIGLSVRQVRLEEWEAWAADEATRQAAAALEAEEDLEEDFELDFDDDEATVEEPEVAAEGDDDGAAVEEPEVAAESDDDEETVEEPEATADETAPADDDNDVDEPEVVESPAEDEAETPAD